MTIIGQRMGHLRNVLSDLEFMLFSVSDQLNLSQESHNACFFVPFAPIFFNESAIYALGCDCFHALY